MDGVFVLTRHDSHAPLTLRALDAGKHIFVEKPLALTEGDLDAIEQFTGGLVMVGFNRRFAPLAVEAKRRVSQRSGPLAVSITVNAGAIPRDHWTQDAQAGGGGIIREACHFFYLARFFVWSPINSPAGIPAARKGVTID